MVESIVQDVIGKYGIRHYHDDLLGAGLLGLVKAVDLISNKPPEISESTWLYVRIRRAVLKEFYGMFLIRVPDRTMRRRKVIRIPKQTSFDRKSHKGLMDAGFREIEDREAVERFLYNETERTVIRKRFEGYSDREIGELLGVSEATVNRIRHEIAGRFANECNEEGRS